MAWKDKLKTLGSKWWVTKEEIDSKATVVFIGYDSDFILRYNGEEFSSTSMFIGGCNGHDVTSNILVMELPFGKYRVETLDNYTGYIFQDEFGNLEVNQKLIFVEAFDLIQRTTLQQEI